MQHGAGSDGLSRRVLLRRAGLGTAGLAVGPLLGACGSSQASNQVKIQYQQFGSGTVMRDYLRDVSAQLSEQGAGISTKLVPLVASEDDYFTKNELMMSSANTAPDLVYEDTFILKSDVAAGYLQPMDSYIRSWDSWKHFSGPSKEAVTGEDGKLYAVPTHTDTRALWYHSELLEAAGISLPWEPQSWDEILDGLRQIKSRSPDVVPFNIFSGKAQGEKASMQGFEMLLYGTGSNLYDDESGAWVLGSQGFRDALTFLQTVFAEELTPPIGDALNPNIGETIYSEWLPQGKLAVNLDGSWISQNWIAGAPGEWPEWAEVMKLARMPTQQGQGAGWVTLAGGWSWGIPKLSDKPDLAWTVLQQMMTEENVVEMAIADNQVTIRDDVRSNDRYRGYSPTIDFFTQMIDQAIYRPAVPAYPQVSSEIQAAMDAVMTGSAGPEQAAADYDHAVTDLVGAQNTTRE